MSSESSSELKFDIGHVLFIDIVGYSRLLIAEQSDQLQTLKEIVRGTEQFKKADAEGKLLRLPTGDGGALVFRNSLEAPVLCALEISKALKSHPELKVRMGIHSGPVNEITDLNEHANIAGVGINLAQRVMDCGDAGHILLSKRVADDLEQYPQWRSHLSALGECEVKHGTRVSVVNLYTDDAGNRAAPEKFSKQSATTSLSGSVPRRNSKFALIAGAALVLVIAIGWWLTHRADRSAGTPRQNVSPARTEAAATSSNVAATIPEKSIAVLPFDNLSDDKSNAYFAEGIQDEILTRLSKIAALKVISRTSTQKYKSAPDNLREVGQQLGVANLLEGSVQKAGNSVHINVQLIKAATDEHLWAESYDRELQNIFGVEGEVAGAIADQLNAKLSGTEKRALAVKPTQNPAAYDAYLRGLAFEGRVDPVVPNIRNSITAFDEATRLDPDFALAWAHLARQQSFLFNLRDQSSQRRDEAHSALEKAMKLAPQSPETQLAEGFYHYWVERDYEIANNRFDAVRAAFPNNSWPPYALAAIARRQGRWEDSRRLFDEALELDPQNVFMLVDASLDDIAMRDAVRAQKHLSRARELSPANSAITAMQAASMQLSGDVTGAQTVLDQAPSSQDDVNLTSAFVNNAEFSRKFAPAIAMLRARLENPQDVGLDLGWFQMSLGDLQRLSGDTGAAAASYEKARVTLQTELRDQPDNPNLVAQLAGTYAGLGDKANALEYAHKAVALLPTSKDALVGPSLEETLARIQARFGDKDSAITALQHLLVTCYSGPPVTAALLRLDPDWDNLRDDPRFEKLCQEK